MTILYCGTPPADMHNVGDHAQAVAIRQWIGKHWPDAEVVEFRKKTPIARIEEAGRDADLLFLHSGGNMCDRGLGLSEKERRAIIRALPDVRKVSLPQTIGFSAKQIPVAREVYSTNSACRTLTILGRDPLSYNFAQTHFLCHSDLCPDFVLGLPSHPGGVRGGVLLCLRSDRESLLGQEGRADFAAAFSGATVHDTNSKRPIHSDADARREMKDLLELWGRHDVVITDRLHGVIFSIMSQTPCVVLPTVDHKLTASWFWFRYYPQVVFADGAKPEDALLAIPQTCALDYWQDVGWENWHNRLAAFIAGRMPPDNLSTLMVSRRTHRRWLPTPVAHELLRHVVRAGVYAPSGSNAQCVRFRIVSDPAEVAVWHRRRPACSKEATQPAAIILCGYDYGVEGVPNYMHKSATWAPLAYQDVAAAMQNMSLFAESLGLATCWVSVFPVGQKTGAVEWLSALYVGWPLEPWRRETHHQGRPVARREEGYYYA